MSDKKETCISCSNFVTGDKSPTFNDVYNRSCSKCRGCYVTFNQKVHNTKPDMINSPEHYTQGDIEAIDAIKSALGSSGYLSYLQGSVLKYMWRARDKGDVINDVAKAKWFLNRLADELEGEE